MYDKVKIIKKVLKRIMKHEKVIDEVKETLEDSQSKVTEQILFNLEDFKEDAQSEVRDIINIRKTDVSNIKKTSNVSRSFLYIVIAILFSTTVYFAMN